MDRIAFLHSDRWIVMERALSDKKLIALFLVPGLTVFLVFYFVPILMTAYYSFQKWDGINPMAFVGLDNYTKMFTADKSFWKAVWNSVAFLLTGVFVQPCLVRPGAAGLPQNEGTQMVPQYLLLPGGHVNDDGQSAVG